MLVQNTVNIKPFTLKTHNLEKVKKVYETSNRSSPSATGSPTASSPLPPISPTHSLDETLIVEMLNSSPNVNKNLSNLQVENKFQLQEGDVSYNDILCNDLSNNDVL